MFERSRATRRLEAVSNRDDLTDVDSDPPVDLVHLARHCLGDHELEDELLRLFRLQSQTLTAQLSDPSQLSLESKAKIAHKLRGSALAIGARRVAGAALRIEELASAAGDLPRLDIDDRVAEAGALLALLFAVTQAVAEIDRIRG
jgi:Hpt domain